jgi:S-adenosylmethionine:tRNA ribosyltransferase-isomerase
VETDIEYYNYDLPERFIAQTPCEPRDGCRMLVYDRNTDRTEIKRFYDILDCLRGGDVVVINETRVIPARLFGHKENGGKVEVLLLQKQTLNTYSALVRPMRKLHIGEKITIADGLAAELLSKDETDGVAAVRLSVKGGTDKDIEAAIDKIGVMPLPPYIHNAKHRYDKEYNTVYARVNGSSASPTAGLHWTKDLMERAEKRGVIFAPVVLNVGLGTFRPVKETDITKHKMHSERYEIPKATAEIINRAKKENRRIIATGTTSLRTLEGCCAAHGGIIAASGSTEIYIYPPYKFKVVDALITNFHLPKSTLIMLVSAFIGRNKTMELYETAKKEGFRFFSFGDCMFLS